MYRPKVIRNRFTLTPARPFVGDTYSSGHTESSSSLPSFLDWPSVLGPETRVETMGDRGRVPRRLDGRSDGAGLLLPDWSLGHTLRRTTLSRTPRPRDPRTEREILGKVVDTLPEY